MANRQDSETLLYCPLHLWNSHPARCNFFFPANRAAMTRKEKPKKQAMKQPGQTGLQNRLWNRQVLQAG